MAAGITPIPVRAELSEAEYKELRLLAVRADATISNYIGWVLRQHLAELGRPIEGSVKA